MVTSWGFKSPTPMENYMWNEYQDFLVKTLNLKVEEDSKIWIHGPKLKSKLYSGDHILKSRETIIDDGKTKIYNNIVYPKTGENLPCFGMDLMCFFRRKYSCLGLPTPNSKI